MVDRGEVAACHRQQTRRAYAAESNLGKSACFSDKLRIECLFHHEYYAFPYNESKDRFHLLIWCMYITVNSTNSTLVYSILYFLLLLLFFIEIKLFWKLPSLINYYHAIGNFLLWAKGVIVHKFIIYTQLRYISTRCEKRRNIQTFMYMCILYMYNTTRNNDSTTV